MVKVESFQQFSKAYLMLTSQIFMTHHVESTHLGLILPWSRSLCAATAEASTALSSARGGVKVEKHTALPSKTHFQILCAWDSNICLGFLSTCDDVSSSDNTGLYKMLKIVSQHDKKAKKRETDGNTSMKNIQLLYSIFLYVRHNMLHFHIKMETRPLLHILLSCAVYLHYSKCFQGETHLSDLFPSLLSALFSALARSFFQQNYL